MFKDFCYSIKEIIHFFINIDSKIGIDVLFTSSFIRFAQSLRVVAAPLLKNSKFASDKLVNSNKNPASLKISNALTVLKTVRGFHSSKVPESVDFSFAQALKIFLK